MKKLILPLFLASLILSTLSSNAQHKDTLKTRNWFKHEIAGALQIQVTYRKSDLSQLNTALNNGGLPSLSDNDIWINASMFHIKNHLIFEDGLGFTPFSTSEVNNVKTRYNQYQAFFRFGYDVSKNSGYRLYPFAGVNFSEAILNIQDKDGERNVSDFSGELLNTTFSKTLYQSNFGIELGAGFDYVIKLKPKQMDCFTLQRNIPIGLRLGYYVHAASGDWKIDNYKLQGDPDKKQSAVFVSLNIGLGYAIKK
ncbi:MAG: hypothetical protein JWP37_3071 [Mucilaginibacter sp.]|nr:hypothetical protein [Mucilaginibacter sp.]